MTIFAIYWMGVSLTLIRYDSEPPLVTLAAAILWPLAPFVWAGYAVWKRK